MHEEKLKHRCIYLEHRLLFWLCKRILFCALWVDVPTLIESYVVEEQKQELQ